VAERAARNPGAVTQICARIAGSSRFQGLIFAVIVFNALVLGLETYDAVDDSAGGLLAALNDACLAVFLAELAIRITAHGRRPQHFFRDGWNVFDFVVITAAFIPGLRQNATLLRLVRLLRIMRIISVLPDVRVLLRGMTRSLPPIASMAVLALLLIYLYGMVGWILFGSEDPRRWGDLGAAMLSLFVMLTLEEWPTYLRAGMDVHPWSWIYFVSYVLVAGFLLINILIGIVINAMEGARREERAAARALRQELLAARAEHEAARAEREAARAEHEELAQLMQNLRDTVEDLEDRLGAAPMVSAGDDRRTRLG
jgi:voltage-gated sodium channel